MFFLEKQQYHKVPLQAFARNFVLCFFTIACGPGLMFSCNEPSAIINSNANYKKVLDSANLAYDHNKYQQAINYLDAATPRYKDLDIGQKFDYYSLNYNYLFHIKKANNLGMLYADSILNLFNTPEKKLKYITKYGQAFFFKGDVLFEESKYNEAYEYFYQGKLIANRVSSKCTLGDFSYRMGMIMYKQEHFSLAAANFKNSSAETGACDLSFSYFYRRQEVLNNTGLCYSKINETDSALFYFKKALDFIDSNAERFNERKVLLDVARGVIYGNEGNVYVKKGNIPLAKALLKQSSEINLRKGYDNGDAELSELKLAHVYYRAHQEDSMINLLRVVRPQLDSVKNQEAEADWNSLMANYFIRKQDPKAALTYLIKYNTLKDSIVARDKGLMEADIVQQIKRLEQDNEFDVLKKDNQQQNLYLKIAAVFVVLILIIFFLILLNWRKSRRNIKILGRLNHQVKDQNHSLALALEELNVSSQEKDRILRTVAHDLRNPLGGIASLTNAMADDGYSEEQQRMITLIKETSNNSLELINEILEVTNNTGATMLNRALVEINALLSHSVELLRFKAAEKNQQIKLELLDKPVDLFISREKIWRVIGNLLSNAIKFSPPGADIILKIIDKGTEVEISVKDSGIGIPENMKSKVFNIFTEAKRPGTAGEKSFGLGLSISKQIVESHGGKIWFESNGGNGTTFFVRLPKP
jgi:signal transduction histidine kinase